MEQERKLVSTLPDSPGKAAVITRARQLTDFRWTPVRDVPTFTKEAGKTTFPAGKEVLGMPYSSAEPNDKFIWENVSMYTLLSAMANPDSALYQKDIGGHRNSWTYYGFVCNGLARYAMGLRRRYTTKHWLDVPGNRMVAEDGKYTVDQIRICDSLFAYGKGRNHVALITDLLRDEDGVIRRVEVSEAVRPACKRADYSVEEFYEKYKLFALCRNDFIDSAPQPDPEDQAVLERGMPKELPPIVVDYGDKSNYLSGEETLISVFAPGEHTVEIVRAGEVIERVPIAAGGKLARKFPRGYYTARLADTGDETQFCVCEPQIDFTVSDGKVTVTARSGDPDSPILYMDFREAPAKQALDAQGKPYGHVAGAYGPLVSLEELTPEEIASGTFTRPIPEGAGSFKVYFENRYGVWTRPILTL